MRVCESKKIIVLVYCVNSKKEKEKKRKEKKKSRVSLVVRHIQMKEKLGFLYGKIFGC